METKEMKIVPPEGYEIDKENSTFECIKFKQIEKAVSYRDISERLFVGEDVYFSNSAGMIQQLYNVEKSLSYDPNNCTSQKQAEKLLAINKLMNVAKCLNGEDWKPNWNNSGERKYYIYCYNGILKIDYICSYIYFAIYFKSKESAQQAIDILGEETIRLALSTDW